MRHSLTHPHQQDTVLGVAGVEVRIGQRPRLLVQLRLEAREHGLVVHHVSPEDGPDREPAELPLLLLLQPGRDLAPREGRDPERDGAVVVLRSRGEEIKAPP